LQLSGAQRQVNADRRPETRQAAQERMTQLFEQGRDTEAEKLASTVTQQFPDDGFSWHLRGMIARKQGRKEDALAFLKTATQLAPTRPEAFNNLGLAFQELERPAEAAASYQRAIALDPTLAAAHSNLGNVLRSIGRLAEAEASCRRAVELDPNFVEARCNLGNVQKELGQLESAEANYRRALEIRPDGATYSNLGNVLRARGKLQEAEVACRRAIQLNAQHPIFHANLGNTLLSLGKLTEAETVFRRALALKPDFAEAHNNLGNVLQVLGRLTAAQASYRRALEIKPRYAKAHSNLLFCSNYLPGPSTADTYAEHRRWEQEQTKDIPRVALRPVDLNLDRRLRVGYVSPDFKQHSVASFLEPLLRQHDRSQWEIFCYADVPQPDAVTARFQAHAHHWLGTVGMADEALAWRIANDQIDILVDLAGHTANNRLLVFARRPAPVQVSWLGYPNTTGLAAIDYRLVDEITDPSNGADAVAAERLIRLANGFLCYGAPAGAPPPAPNPHETKGAITFGSFNNPAKLSSPLLDSWSELLRCVPNSQLLLKGKTFTDTGGQDIFLQRLDAHGIDRSRVTLLGRTPGIQEHLALYAQVDIALDSFPYNGTTTTCEALWMGVPVIALRGDRHAARVGASILTRLGLTELVADSVQAYVELAAKLASNHEALRTLRQTLRRRMAESVLCDAPGFARNVEAVFRQMWQAFCAAQLHEKGLHR
jgi:predicted O-linked N-acetylglucosamine transferase (SPINDLY family)